MALVDEYGGPLRQTIYENTYLTEPEEVRSAAGSSLAAAAHAAPRPP